MSYLTIIFAVTVIRIFQEKDINTWLRSPVADSRANRSVSFRTKKEKGSSDHEEDSVSYTHLVAMSLLANARSAVLMLSRVSLAGIARVSAV